MAIAELDLTNRPARGVKLAENDGRSTDRASRICLVGSVPSPFEIGHGSGWPCTSGGRMVASSRGPNMVLTGQERTRAPFCHGSYGLRSRGIWWDLPGFGGIYRALKRVFIGLEGNFRRPVKISCPLNPQIALSINQLILLTAGRCSVVQIGEEIDLCLTRSAPASEAIVGSASASPRHRPPTSGHDVPAYGARFQR